MPAAWLRRKVFQLCDGAPRDRATMCLATVDCATRIPRIATSHCEPLVSQPPAHSSKSLLVVFRPAPAVVLEEGGGAGAYAFPLAAMGYNV